MKTLLLPFLLLPLCGSSPVAYIMHQSRKSPLILSSSIIATEKYLITPKNPISTYALSELCALATLNMHELSEHQLKALCVPLEEMYLSSPTLAVIKLSRELPFLGGINAAEIPLVDSFNHSNFSSDCKIVYHMRHLDLIISQSVESVVTISDDPEKLGMDATLETEQRFCVQDNGLPLYCQGAIVGLFVYSEEAGKMCCVSECSTGKKVKAVRLLTKDDQELLKMFIPEHIFH